MSTFIKLLFAFCILSACTSSNISKNLQLIEKEYNEGLHRQQAINIGLAHKIQQYYYNRIGNHHYDIAFNVSVDVDIYANKVRTYLLMQKIKLHLHDIDLEIVKTNTQKLQKELLKQILALFQQHKKALYIEDSWIEDDIKRPVQREIQSYFEKDSMGIKIHNKKIKELSILQMQILVEKNLRHVYELLIMVTESNRWDDYELLPFANLDYTQDSIQFNLFMGRFHRLAGANLYIQQLNINGKSQIVQFPYSVFKLPVDTNSRDVQVFNVDAQLYDPSKDSLINFQQQYTYKHK